MATAVSVIWKQINTRPLPYEISLWMANRKWMPNRCQSKWENDVQHEQLHIRSTYKHQYAEHFRKTQSRDQTKLTHKSPENIQDKLSICITVPNFTLFSRTTRRYSVFRFFMMAAVRHLGFVKVQNFNCRHSCNGKYASPCQISCRSIKTFPKYGHFLIFQDGGVCYLGFVEVQNFSCRYDSVSMCIIGPNCAPIAQTTADIWQNCYKEVNIW